MARMNQRWQRELRREQAQERREARDSRSNQEQLEELNRRLGEGQGAKRERSRLESLMESE